MDLLVLPFPVVIFKVLGGVLVVVVIVFRGVMDCVDKVLSCVIGVGVEVIDIMRGSVLGSDIIIFLILKVLLDPVSFIIMFY